MSQGLTRYRPPAFDDFDTEVWTDIVEHFRQRYSTHRKLRRLLKDGMDADYVQLALGLSDQVGNYSASEHAVHLGHKILERTGATCIAMFARNFLLRGSCRELPDAVQREDIPYLKTSIGSEMMCLLRPESCWVTNKRTVYVYFLYRNDDDWEKAADAIEAITSSGDIGDTYDAWSSIHPEIVHPLLALAEAGTTECRNVLQRAGLTRHTAEARFLWADAISSMVYDWRTWE